MGAYPVPVGQGASFAVTKADATGVEAVAPSALVLEEPRPNPFADRATLAFELPASSAVRLVVYDVLGREVAVLVDRDVEAGRHEAVFG